MSALIGEYKQKYMGENKDKIIADFAREVDRLNRIMEQKDSKLKVTTEQLTRARGAARQMAAELGFDVTI